MTVSYLTIAEVRYAQQLEIEDTGGSHGVRDEGALEAAIMRPQQTFGGEELYPDLFSKAAALFHSIVKNHPFVDGNKRTAVAVTNTFLQVNGEWPRASNEELVEFVTGAAVDRYNIEEIAAWFRAQCRDN